MMVVAPCGMVAVSTTARGARQTADSGKEARMGAYGFYTEASGPTAKQAFAKAVDQAAWEFGHGGYTGTIAEKGGDGFVDLGEVPTMAEAHEKAGKLIGDDDPRVSRKWGPCGAFRIAGSDRYLFFGLASS